MVKKIIVLILIITGVEAFSSGFFLEKSSKSIKKADVIIEAFVDDLNIKYSNKISIGCAWMDLKVLDYIKGICPAEITIGRFGIDSKGNFMHPEYNPVFKKGDKIIICLIKLKDGNYCPIGLINGKWDIENETIKGLGISKSEFKQSIKDLLNNKITDFPDNYNKKVLYKSRDKEKNG
jgi:hypothetical protein